MLLRHIDILNLIRDKFKEKTKVEDNILPNLQLEIWNLYALFSGFLILQTFDKPIPWNKKYIVGFKA